MRRLALQIMKAYETDMLQRTRASVRFLAKTSASSVMLGWAVPVLEQHATNPSSSVSSSGSSVEISWLIFFSVLLQGENLFLVEAIQPFLYLPGFDPRRLEACVHFQLVSKVTPQ